MGNFCPLGTTDRHEGKATPDVETRRQKQMEAAERRIAEEQRRGIKNVEAVKRQERLDQLRDKRLEEAGNKDVQGSLKWQMN